MIALDNDDDDVPRNFNNSFYNILNVIINDLPLFSLIILPPPPYVNSNNNIVTLCIKYYLIRLSSKTCKKEKALFSLCYRDGVT